MGVRETRSRHRIICIMIFRELLLCGSGARAGGVMTKPERGDKYKCHPETEPEVKMQT